MNRSVPCDRLNNVEPACPAVATQKSQDRIPNVSGIIEYYQKPLLRYVHRILLNDEDAQDVVQETFLRYVRCLKLHGQESVRSLSSWLYRVAHNLAQDQLRQRKREKKAKDGMSPAPGRVENNEFVGGLIHEAACDRALSELKKLPEGQRQVLHLKIIGGLTLRDTAKVLGLSFGNVAYRLNQGLKEIAARLKEAEVI